MDEEEQSDPPIEPVPYTHGVKVIDFGEARIARGYSRRPHRTCPHRSVVYDTAERRVWCEDCEKNVDPFDVLVARADDLHKWWHKIVAGWSSLQEAQTFVLRSRAARTVDKLWRSRTSRPRCPTCQSPLLPADFADERKAPSCTRYEADAFEKARAATTKGE